MTLYSSIQTSLYFDTLNRNEETLHRDTTTVVVVRHSVSAVSPYRSTFYSLERTKYSSGLTVPLLRIGRTPGSLPTPSLVLPLGTGARGVLEQPTWTWSLVFEGPQGLRISYPSFQGSPTNFYPVDYLDRRSTVVVVSVLVYFCGYRSR